MHILTIMDGQLRTWEAHYRFSTTELGAMEGTC
jgi:hypothetical protein